MHEPVQRKRYEKYLFHDSTIETKLASYITSGLTTGEKLSESVRNLIYGDIWMGKYYSRPPSCNSRTRLW